VSIRLDSDVLDWFKDQGKGYQSIMFCVHTSIINKIKHKS